MKDLKLGIQMGYWGAGPNPAMVDIAKEAEKLGYDAVFTAEAWGSDVFTPLAWIGAHTTRIRLGTAVAQLSARTPTATAMAALTLDHLSNGRVILGLGVSGPQVVEGWYGAPFGKPLPTRPSRRSRMPTLSQRFGLRSRAVTSRTSPAAWYLG